MPKHIRRLLLLLGIAAIAAIAAKEILTAPSFGDYGHYRAASVPEIAAQKPLYQGTATCQQCHKVRVNTWRQGTHATVQCESCHGPAGEHPVSGKMPIPKYTVQLCSSCHEALPTRPATSIKQVVIADHMGEQACVECHNPHSPTHFTWDNIEGLANQLRSSPEIPHG